MWIFAVNEKSGGGRGKKVWRRVEAELVKRGVPYRAVMAGSPEEADAEIRWLIAAFAEHGGSAEAADSLAETEGAGAATQPRTGVKAVCVIGGDGTIHSVLPALVDSGVPLGIIPSGSGNDSARAFGVPAKPLDALARILAGHAMPVDLILLRSAKAAHGGGTAAERPVLTALAVGFDAAIADAVNRSAHKTLCNLLGVGSVAYLIGLLQILLTYRQRQLTVTVDGTPHRFERGWMAAVCSVPAYGGGLRICPNASPTDGLLDVCVVHTCTPLQLLRLFPTLLSGTHTRLPYVKMLRGRPVSVAAEPQAGTDALAIYGDGEPVGEAPLYAESAGHRLLLLSAVTG
ncbi:diacylglycerol/lipid kinase family protein [Paenibacillus montanisoli]|uniref:Diacylglycerol kinase family lipid kinase n=1 Tax=Paenibacillus montanisoli TaxID=2081970 RepID=A0A328TVD2_9BACL|nr:diacylglycerol kinase family protein [Paenibacillus montanisoli]RAP74477.1 diacylglycerol kinase family lipid kinase [Paenibacillus montanisoli]